MTDARGESGQRALVGDLPPGSLLVALAALAVGAFALLPLLLAALLLVGSRALGLRLRFLAVLAGMALVALGIAGLEPSWHAYAARAPLWEARSAFEDEGGAAWLSSVLPVTLAAASLLAAVGYLWLDYRAPFWAEKGTRSLAGRLRARRGRRRLAARHRPHRQGVALGLDASGSLVALSTAELGQHALVVGATGSGKTTTVVQVLRGLVRRRAGLVVVDLKGDPDLAHELEGLARASDRPFDLWTLDGPASWNPLARGGATELMDKLVGLEEWTEPHYKRAAQRFLHTVLSALEATGERPSLARVASLLHPEALLAILDSAQELPSDERERIDAYVDALDGSAKSAIQGLAHRLALLSETRAGAYLGEGEDAIDLYRTLADGRLTVFSLDGPRYGETAGQVAALAIRDLKTVAAERLRTSPGGKPSLAPGYLVLDEFSTMGSDHVLALLARGRSARLGVILATQELADLARVDPGFADQVLGNTNVKIVHRQDVPESAERLAGVAGTRSAWEETLQTDRSPLANVAGRTVGGWSGRNTGRGTIRRVEEYIVHPNALKRLGQGEAVVIRKHPRARVERVRIVAPRTERTTARTAFVAAARARLSGGSA